ncbi:MAG TPA: hypothetical protein RMG95_11660 [Polyangiaceae bacterium LLY-WYZ-15_(1-7)]|nr:hypothetical protein [Polyangiaceae bacterium LLY-WYZ-15_(1-7)]HJL22913.1 hypothetical protein [Polyangiaceae bacterium LLY-WYZ-15_(1-7)]HJL36331.1 hypothetical protein [Polyangiaceae bacterium LLY-WYZ-15_(1-7)]|tara:strand:- start:262 stop:474 length:213 start_codon:yes stop_codon:yes gene_type:complete
MVEALSKKLKGLSFEDLAEVIAEDREFREALIKHIAKDHAEDYLGEVNVNARVLAGLSARVVSSNKEWQE